MTSRRIRVACTANIAPPVMCRSPKSATDYSCNCFPTSKIIQTGLMCSTTDHYGLYLDVHLMGRHNSSRQCGRWKEDMLSASVLNKHLVRDRAYWQAVVSSVVVKDLRLKDKDKDLHRHLYTHGFTCAIWTRKLCYRKDDRAMPPCDLYMDALIFSGLPDYAHRYCSQHFSWAFVPIEAMNVGTKFEVRSFTRSWDNRGYAPFSPKFLMGFYSDWPCKCTRQIWSP